MPDSKFKKIRKQFAEGKIYDDLVTKIQSNLSDAGEATRYQLAPNSQVFNDYDASDAYKTLQGVKEDISGPNAPDRYFLHRRALREANKNVLPDLLRRSEMMNALNLDPDAQNKAISNDLINKRVATGKIYDFPELKTPNVRHSENDFIDKIVRSQAAKKMEQEGAEKVVSSFLNARRGILEGLKKTGKLGLKALPVVGTIADIAVTPTIGEASDNPIGPQLTSEDFKKIYGEK